MSVTTQPAELMTSTELSSLLDQAARLSGAAGRADLTERLGRAKARLSGRGMRVVVLGAPGQGATSLAHVLEQTPPDRLPGAQVTDVPSRPRANFIQIPEPGVADVVLFVADAGHEYNPAELDALARLRAQGAAVAGVITKIDVFPRWAEVQRGNRRRLQAANLDSPTIPLLPVSAALAENGRVRADESLTVASGVPQLVDFLRDRVGTKVDPATREAVLGEVRTVTDELTRAWNGELGTLQKSGGGSPQERQQRAMAELERRQQLSANWQIALGDGITELMAQVDFDLRERLREVMEIADAEITKATPTKKWRQFDGWIRGKISENVMDNYQLARDRSRKLSEQVAAKLVGNADGSANGVPQPKLQVPDPDEALQQVKAMQPLEAAQGGMFARVVNSLRGGYSGILMVGLVVTLLAAGQQNPPGIMNPYSIGAGVLLGIFTFYEDYKGTKERAKGEAKMSVSKLMDEANFRVGDDLRTQLRAIQRNLRDHYTVINDQRLREAAEAANAAAQAAAQQNGNGAGSAARLSEIQTNLAELRQLRVNATPGR